MLLTHAHIDHSGLLPKLVREGFGGRILATRGTIDLCSYMLPDSGGIQESEVAALNRRNAARGRPEVTPIYTQADAKAALQSFQPVEYEKWVDVIPGVRARYWNAGHLLGSASIEIEFDGAGAAGQPLRVLASGDVGPDAKLLQPDPRGAGGLRLRDIGVDLWRQDPRKNHAGRTPSAPGIGGARCRGGQRRPADPRLRGRTYPGTDRRSGRPDGAWQHTRPRRSFSIPRWRFMRRRFSGSTPKAWIKLSTSIRLFNSPHLRFTETVDESKAIAKLTGFHIIIAASGMCDAGRIRHHLKRWLWSNHATVLLVGFQAHGTLGRFLQDGAKSVRIQGDEIKVAARIRMIDEYSGHADGSEIAQWVAARRPIERGVFLVHGEEQAIAGWPSASRSGRSGGQTFPAGARRRLRTLDTAARADRRRAPTPAHA